MLSIFSCSYWSFVCLLQRNVYPNLLPILKPGCGIFWTCTHRCVYLFVYGCAGSLLLYMGFLYLQRGGYSLVVMHRLLMWGFFCGGAQALCVQASVVVALGLSCSLACGLFPDQGLNLCPLNWQADSYPSCGILVPWPGIKPRPSTVRAWSPNHWTTRKSPKTFSS